MCLTDDRQTFSYASGADYVYVREYDESGNTWPISTVSYLEILASTGEEDLIVRSAMSSARVIGEIIIVPCACKGFGSDQCQRKITGVVGKTSGSTTKKVFGIG